MDKTELHPTPPPHCKGRFSSRIMFGGGSLSWGRSPNILFFFHKKKLESLTVNSTSAALLGWKRPQASHPTQIYISGGEISSLFMPPTAFLSRHLLLWLGWGVASVPPAQRGILALPYIVCCQVPVRIGAALIATQCCVIRLTSPERLEQLNHSCLLLRDREGEWQTGTYTPSPGCYQYVLLFEDQKHWTGESTRY